MTIPFDDQLDLRFERHTALSPAAIWMAWTRPEHLMPWFCPRPWSTIDCEIDLRPGGLFRTVMRSPEGQEYPNIGCYLEIVPQRRLVWTNAMSPGFRPVPRLPQMAGDDFFPFTGIITLTPEDNGTRYLACVRHATPEDCQKHADMGFAEGWGMAFEQLVAYLQSRPA